MAEIECDSFSPDRSKSQKHKGLTQLKGIEKHVADSIIGIFHVAHQETMVTIKI